MQKRYTKNPLPKSGWSSIPGGEKAILIADIQVTRGSRLRLKVLVFESIKDMDRFWTRGLKLGRLGRDCKGAVSSLSCQVIPFPSEREFMEVDPRYFAIMGLLSTHLTEEIVAHESGHAAIAFANRSSARWPGDAFDEEKICYPLGRIFYRVMDLLRGSGLLCSANPAVSGVSF